MMILAIISKLPTDLKDVQHILPFWFTFLYYFAWVIGTALVLSLIIYLCAKLFRYLQSIPAKDSFKSETAKERRYSKVELYRDLKIIMNNTINNDAYRFGLHRMSAVMKMYFEIALDKQIEEMTAKEIRTHVTERKELGKYFTELTVVQFRSYDPDKEEFMGYYRKALTLVR